MCIKFIKPGAPANYKVIYRLNSFSQMLFGQSGTFRVSQL